MRGEFLEQTNRLVVKVGTRVLSDSEGRLDAQQIARLVAGVVHWMDSGRRVALVSSGAVGAGMGLLRLKQRPHGLADLQAVAAAGQTHLIQAYDQAFAAHGRRAAQVLLTAEDARRRTSYLNTRNALLASWKLGLAPVINENDTVAVEELQTAFGDNDRLAALVANLLDAPLVILSDVDALYDGDPAEPTSRPVASVEHWTREMRGWVRDRESGVSKGGMASKLKAARLTVRSGNFALIAGGREPRVLQRLLAGEPLGTFFSPSPHAISSRKRWIGWNAPPNAAATIDDGACRALLDRGGSLLAIGVREVLGEFHKGDVISIRSLAGEEIARGLCNYNATDLRRVAGLHSEQIAQVLGRRPYDEVVHRDNLAILLDDADRGPK